MFFKRLKKYRKISYVFSNTNYRVNIQNLNSIWAKLPKSGKLEKLKKNYNFLKIVSVVVDFFSHIVKFDFGLRNNILEFAPSFVLFEKNYFVFLRQICPKNRSKSR